MKSCNNILKKLSNQLQFGRESSEKEGIQRTLLHLETSIKNHFKSKVTQVKRFGSYKRGTILPRDYDPQSDVDLMIVFDSETKELSPGTYRKKIQEFAMKIFSAAEIYKDFPSIVIELDHINFDLVPAVKETDIWGGETLYIPDSNDSWQETDPDEFNETLKTANQTYNSLVKPIVRLVKYWNANRNYLFNSYDLERQIADMSFDGDNYLSGFLYALKELDHEDYPDYVAKKLNGARQRADYFEFAESDANYKKMILHLSNLLPAVGDYQ